jgi:hypothetical protein
MTSQWCKLVEEVKMKTINWSCEAFVEFLEDFKFQCQLVGKEFAPPEKEIVKIFLKGLSPPSLQTEIRRRLIESLEEVIDVTSDVIVKYKAVFDLQPSAIKKDKDYSHTKKKQVVSDTVVTSSATVPDKESNKAFGTKKVEDKKPPTCYNCLQKGHLAYNCPNPRHPESTWKARRARSIKKSDDVPDEEPQAVARSVRVFSTDLVQSTDEFIRIPTKLLLAQDETNMSAKLLMFHFFWTLVRISIRLLVLSFRNHYNLFFLR